LESDHGFRLPLTRYFCSLVSAAAARVVGFAVKEEGHRAKEGDQEVLAVRRAIDEGFGFGVGLTGEGGVGLNLGGGHFRARSWFRTNW